MATASSNFLESPNFKQEIENKLPSKLFPTAPIIPPVLIRADISGGGVGEYGVPNNTPVPSTYNTFETYNLQHSTASQSHSAALLHHNITSGHMSINSPLEEDEYISPLHQHANCDIVSNTTSSRPASRPPSIKINTKTSDYLDSDVTMTPETHVHYSDKYDDYIGHNEDGRSSRSLSGAGNSSNNNSGSNLLSGTNSNNNSAYNILNSNSPSPKPPKPPRTTKASQSPATHECK
jgi:hypothetical protein